MRFSWRGLCADIRPSLRVVFSRNLILLRGLILLLLVLALARPQARQEADKVRSEGIAIVLALDVSTSMLAEDFRLEGKRVNRLEAVKDVARDFIRGRDNDTIGIVVFAGRAYSLCPLTLDYGWLLKNLARIKIGMIEDGTAVGSGLASALNRLKDNPARSKVVILLTDGRNNAGDISPQTAAEAARALKVKVYTIGAGTKGLAPYPAKDFFGNRVYQPMPVDIDEDTLIKISADTDGRYFRATDTKSLREIYKEIDRMEKAPIEEQGYVEHKELFGRFLFAGLILLLLEIALKNTIFSKMP